jgi:tetratricopeptide (TPR) repeat protein
MPIPKTLKLAVACAAISFSFGPAVHAESAERIPAKPAAAESTLSSEFIYKYLVGEIAGQRGELNLASQLFLDLAKTTHDARLAERAARAAVFGNNREVALEAANLWIAIDPQSVEAQQAMTQMLVSIGKLSEAKPHLEKLLAKEDTRANGFLYLNSLLQNQTDKAAVLALVQDLAKPYPQLPEARFAIATAALAANQPLLAISELELAEKSRPGWEAGAILHGQILFNQTPERALEYYREYLDDYPEANEVRLTLARLLVSQKRFEEAKAEFVKLVEASNNSPEVLVVVGLLSFQAMEYTEAEKYFQSALKEGFKDRDQVFLYLGQIAEKQKNNEQALTWYKKIEFGERYLEAQFNIANLLAQTKNTDAALQLLDGLTELNDEQQALVAQAKANLLARDKRYQEAFELLEKAVGAQPATPELIYDYAMAAERIQRLDVMEKELRRLIEIKPDFAQAYNALGYTLADRNVKLEEARQLIEKALTLSPNDHYILDSMGWVHYRLGKLDQAVDYLRRAYTAQTDPEIAAHLGEVLWQQGKREEAMRTWEDALREHPENEALLNTTRKFTQ